MLPVVPPVGEELTGQLVRLLVHSVDPEADLVDPLDLARGLAALHQGDDRAAQALGVGPGGGMVWYTLLVSPLLLLLSAFFLQICC